MKFRPLLWLTTTLISPLLHAADPETAKIEFFEKKIRPILADNCYTCHAADTKPSPRGELEITDVNRKYLENKQLSVELMGRGMAWLDTGTHESLLDASQFIATIEKRQGLKVAVPEEIAYYNGYIDAAQLERLAEPLKKNGYGQYLLQILQDKVVR